MTRDRFLAQAYPALTMLLAGFHRERGGGHQDWRAVVRAAMVEALPGTIQVARIEAAQALTGLDDDYLALLTAGRYNPAADGLGHRTWLAALRDLLNAEAGLFECLMTPDELRGCLEAVPLAGQLEAILPGLFPERVSIPEALAAGMPPIFYLCASRTADDAREEPALPEPGVLAGHAYAAGWLRVTPGSVVDGGLHPTMISYTSSHREAPARLSQVKAALGARLTSEIRMSAPGGETTLIDVRASPGAVALYGQGVEWTCGRDYETPSGRRLQALRCWPPEGSPPYLGE